jgi:hypothetical protein
MLHRLILITVMLCFGFAAVDVSAAEAIGTVSRIQGDASGINSGTTRALGLNASVFLGEVVTTAPAARLEITFHDDTRLTLGGTAKLTLDRYIFDSGTGRGTLKFAVAGAFRFVSGRLSKLARSDVNVTTPVATIGIRGTEFWGGPIDDQALGVFLVEGAVRVSNAAGARILSRAGQGTNVATAGRAPGPVTFWPREKVNRAIATVAFQ